MQDKQPPVASEEEAPPSLIQTATENLSGGVRRILVAGPRGSGKTTFSVSASHFAGDRIDSGEHRVCKDTLVVQGDAEGIMGAQDAGLEPGMVLDMSYTATWNDYMARLIKGLREVWPLKKSGQLKVIVVDLAIVSKLIDRAIPPMDKDWKQVSKYAQDFFHAFDPFNGVTVIGNTQMKVSTIWGEGTKKGPLESAVNVADARAIGGERSAFTIDLPARVSSLWLDNASFVFMRQVLRKKGKEHGRTYRTITQSSSQYEAKSRAHTKLAPTEDGEQTMHSLLRKAYGDAL